MIHLLDVLWRCGSAPMWRASWQGAVAVALAWGVCRLVPRMPAALRCWVWRGAYLKLLVTLVWLMPIELPLLRAGPLGDAVAGPVEFTATRPVARLSAGAILRFDSPASPRSALQRAIAWTDLLVLLWVTGAAVCAAELAWRWLAVRQDRNRSSALTDAWMLELYSQAAGLVGVRRPPMLAVSADGGGPRIVGFLRPMVIVPAALLESRDRRRLQLLFAHELAHHRRHDLWWAWVPAIARILFWFNPAIWVAQRQWHAAEESACDQAALSALDAAPGDYARMLLEIASRFPHRARAPMVIGVIESRKTLERRLIAMRNIPLWSRPRRISFGAALVFLGAIATVPWRLVAGPPAGEAAGPQAATDAAPTTAPAIHPPLQRRADYERNADSPLARHQWWRYDNIVTGRIHSPFAYVGASIAGAVQKVECTEGQRAKKGDVLIILDSARQKAAMAEAEAELKKAEITYQRLAQLQKQAAVSPSDVASAAADREIAAAKVGLARADLAETRITAPISGVVTSCRVSPGQVVGRTGTDADLVEIMDVDQLSASFDVNSTLLPYLREGRKVKIFLDDSPDRSVVGSINFIAPVASDSWVQVKASIEGTRQLLRPGMAVSVDLQLYREQDLPK